MKKARLARPVAVCRLVDLCRDFLGCFVGSISVGYVKRAIPFRARRSIYFS